MERAGRISQQDGAEEGDGQSNRRTVESQDAAGIEGDGHVGVAESSRGKGESGGEKEGKIEVRVMTVQDDWATSGQRF